MLHNRSAAGWLWIREWLCAFNAVAKLILLLARGARIKIPGSLKWIPRITGLGVKSRENPRIPGRVGKYASYNTYCDLSSLSLCLPNSSLKLIMHYLKYKQKVFSQHHSLDANIINILPKINVLYSANLTLPSSPFSNSLLSLFLIFSSAQAIKNSHGYQMNEKH